MDKHPLFAREISPEGRLKFQTPQFATPFGPGPGALPVEAGRYRLLWMPACPYAHRAVIVRRLLGLEEVISLGMTGPHRTPRGWVFNLDPDGVDPVLKIRYVAEAYEAADPTYSDRPTVPVVVDLSTGKAVYNNHHRLTNELETAWEPFHRPGAPDLYPEALRKDIDALNDELFEDVNAGVYKCGFAHTQAAYEEAFDVLFRRLDELDQHLSHNKFLFGDQLVDTDIRLYTTLVRFDIVYYSAFRTNWKRIADYPSLQRYLGDLYALPEFHETTHLDLIKSSYFQSPHLIGLVGNPLSLLPAGPAVAWAG
jgi:putative glutathione S-transferase